MADLYKLEREPEVLSAYRQLRETEAEEARIAEEKAAAETARAAAEAEAAALAAAEVEEADSLSNRLRELGEAHDEGLITDEEYQARKRELLDRR